MNGVEVAGSVLAAFSFNDMNQIKFKTQFCGFWMLMKIIIVYASRLGIFKQVFQIHVCMDRQIEFKPRSTKCLNPNC